MAIGVSYGDRWSPLQEACQVFSHKLTRDNRLGVSLLGFILYRVGSVIDRRKDVAWFWENMANEPNDPEKLPVIDK